MTLKKHVAECLVMIPSRLGVKDTGKRSSIDTLYAVLEDVVSNHAFSRCFKDMRFASCYTDSKSAIFF